MIAQSLISKLSNRLHQQSGGRRIPEAVLERDYCVAWFLVQRSHIMLHKTVYAGALSLDALSSFETVRSLKIEENEWLTSEEAARYLRISEPTLRNMTSNRRVPYYI